MSDEPWNDMNELLRRAAAEPRFGIYRERLFPSDARDPRAWGGQPTEGTEREQDTQRPSPRPPDLPAAALRDHPDYDVDEYGRPFRVWDLTELLGRGN
jgi:hypothetical protein